jgi:hypothetical protein
MIRPSSKRRKRRLSLRLPQLPTGHRKKRRLGGIVSTPEHNGLGLLPVYPRNYFRQAAAVRECELPLLTGT